MLMYNLFSFHFPFAFNTPTNNILVWNRGLSLICTTQHNSNDHGDGGGFGSNKKYEFNAPEQRALTARLVHGAHSTEATYKVHDVFRRVFLFYRLRLLHLYIIQSGHVSRILRPSLFSCRHVHIDFPFFFFAFDHVRHWALPFSMYFFCDIYSRFQKLNG